MIDTSLGVKQYDIITGPSQMTVDITNRCNLRCLHCFNYSGENAYIDDELTDDELLKLIDDIVVFKPFNVCFCGGETLLRKNIILKLAKKLSDNHIMISMVSNGILLTENVAKELKSSGISRVQISLDGIGESHDKLRGKKGVYEKAIQALKNLKEVGIRSGVAFSVTPWNIHQFKDVVKICSELGVKEVRIQALMPIGRGDINKEKIICTDDQYRELLKDVNECKKTIDNLDIEWGDPIDHLIRFPSLIECNTLISIRADGSIVPSVYLPLSVGNIRKHSIIEYWNKGLSRIWEMDILKNMSDNYRSVMTMDSKNYNLPKTFLEKDIYYDIIDNKTFENK